jgi:hypothetical protein
VFYFILGLTGGALFVEEQEIRVEEEGKRELRVWLHSFTEENLRDFSFCRSIAVRLGLRVVQQRAEGLFWIPELSKDKDMRVFLEILRPQELIVPEELEQQVNFVRFRFLLEKKGEFAYGSFAGIRAGDRDNMGDFYRLVLSVPGEEEHFLYDPMAVSVPYGAFAPAELYDVEKLQKNRSDHDYFQSLSLECGQSQYKKNGRVKKPVNILQVHVATASEEKTFRGLTSKLRLIANKIRSNQLLTSGEKNWLDFEAVQLMPIEPVINYENGQDFFHILKETDCGLQVELRKPDVINWGYDTPLSCSGAVNPVLLGSGRPDEFVDFICELHNFPKPLLLILDLVFGHADNQGLKLLNSEFFTGSNMYGQDINYRHPMVRAILLEMQTRKADFGVDGLRIDGAQDFKFFDHETGNLQYDDDFLLEMGEQVQEVCKRKYLPFMIYEDGRPWPQDDWELSSSYHSVVDFLPWSYQWGPLTFSHNTPFVYTFWITKWWRIKEIISSGGNWINGCTNHDTMRRGAQVDPESRINRKLGLSLKEIIRKGYNNPVEKMLCHCFFPGIPMDFINGLMQAPWSFFRNTDDKWAVKIISEEKRFLDWQVDESDYSRDINFQHLKALGFAAYQDAYSFMSALAHLVELTGYNQSDIADLLNQLLPDHAAGSFTEEKLLETAHAWMNDIFAYCNVSLYEDGADSVLSDFNLELRRFRLANPWLSSSFSGTDFFDYLSHVGSVVFYGQRTAPDQTQLLYVANMEGGEVEIELDNLYPGSAERGEEPRLLLKTPDLQLENERKFILNNAQGVLFKVNYNR